MVVHICNPSSWEVEARTSEVQLHNKFKTSSQTLSQSKPLHINSEKGLARWLWIKVLAIQASRLEFGPCNPFTCFPLISTWSHGTVYTYHNHQTASLPKISSGLLLFIHPSLRPLSTISIFTVSIVLPFSECHAVDSQFMVFSDSHIWVA